MSQWPRTIVVMRHAKAASVAESDSERALLAAGHAAAQEAGAWLASRLGAPPARALVSSALRTRQTWEALALGAGWTSAAATIEDGLYSAGTDSALEYLRETPEEAETVFYLGHNPTVSYLIHLLEDGEAAPPLFEQISGSCPPAAVAILGARGPWAGLRPGHARLLDFHVGGVGP